MLSKIVDGVVLVYKVGTVPKKTFQLCKERLEAVQANIIGVVLNGLKPETAGSAYSKYGMKAYVPRRDAAGAKQGSVTSLRETHATNR